MQQQATSLEQSQKTSQSLAELAESLQVSSGAVVGSEDFASSAEELSAAVQELSGAASEILAALDQIGRAPRSKLRRRKSRRLRCCKLKKLP